MGANDADGEATDGDRAVLVDVKPAKEPRAETLDVQVTDDDGEVD